MILHLKLLTTLLILVQIASLKCSINNCNYEDTVDLTGSQRFSNGSYLYQETLIPAKLTGTYDYEIFGNKEEAKVPLHTRGCVCKLKPCIKLCCHPRFTRIDDTRECIENDSEEMVDYNKLKINVTHGSRIHEHNLNEFIIQQGIPCTVAYHLIPQETELDVWQLFEVGTAHK